MSTRTLTASIIVGVIALIGVGAGVALSAESDDTTEEETFTFEVAEDANRFVFDEAPVFDDGLPAYGNPFVTQGYLYEEGTLADGGGVNADGSPTHPEAVIGTWTCEGFLIGDGAHTTEGPWVVSTQVFDFGEFDGFDTVVSHGIETPEIGEDVERAIVGGTGEHASAEGVQVQVLESFNDTEGVNLSVTFVPEDD